MQSELDRKFDETLAEIIGPGGRLVIERDDLGRAYVANFPGTLPLFFKTFCALNGAVEAVVAGEERLTFADLDQVSDRLAPALASRGIGKGDRVAEGPIFGRRSRWMYATAGGTTPGVTKEPPEPDRGG